jgi:hypothetical protein
MKVRLEIQGTHLIGTYIADQGLRATMGKIAGQLSVLKAICSLVCQCCDDC